MAPPRARVPVIKGFKVPRTPTLKKVVTYKAPKMPKPRTQPARPGPALTPPRYR